MNVCETPYWLVKTLDRELHRVRPSWSRRLLHYRASIGAIVFSIAWLVLPSLHANTMALTRVADPVFIDGRELKAIQQSEIRNIRLFAFDGAQKRDIPFQIDERDSAGNWVWDRVIGRPDTAFADDGDQVSRSMLVREHVHTRDDQDPTGPARFDANDVLVFLARDMGDKHEGLSKARHDDKVIEIEVLDPVAGTMGWAYLVSFASNPPPMSRVRYMRHSRGQRRIRTPTYEFSYSDTKVACLDDLRINGVTVVDRINIRGKLDIQLGFLKDSIEFGEEDLHGYIEGIIEGPVRIIKRNVVHLDVYAMMRTPDTVCEHFYYPDYAQVPLCLPIRFPVTKATVLLSTKLNESAIQRTLIGESDGSVTRHGNTMVKGSPKHRLPIQWIAFDTGQASVLSILELPEKIADHAEARPCVCDPRDGSIEVEVSAIPEPVAGFVVASSEGCPTGPHVLHGTYLISKSPYRQGDEEAAYQLIGEELVVKTTQQGKER